MFLTSSSNGRGVLNLVGNSKFSSNFAPRQKELRRGWQII